MIKSKGFWIVPIVFVLIISGSVAGWKYTQTQVNADSSYYEDLKVFTEVLAVVNKNYVEPTDNRALIYNALKGMMKSLDPHSSFLTPDDYKEMKVDTKGEFGGLGIQISIRDGVLTVIAPIEDTPAYSAGIEAGDKIIKIEDELTKDMSLTEAVSKMRGKKGTEITIWIIREGLKELKPYKIVRDIIKIKSVKKRVIQDTIGYIKLSQFQERSAADMEKALRELSEESKISSLILDLRNNPGGLLSSAIDISGLFLERGALVVYTKSRDGERVEYRSRTNPFSTNMPMVVLVNQGSASASEIVSGAMKDWKRAVVLGQTTFGKGSVQSVIPLSDGSGVRLTTSKYYTPQGTSIQNTGITPDILVKLKPTEGAAEHPIYREKDLQGRLDNEQVDSDDKMEKPKDSEGEGEGESMVSLRDLDDEHDTQLQRAIDLLKTWVIFKELPTDKG